MHEFSVMSYLLETVEAKGQELGAQRILAINLVVGERSSIVDDSMLFYFDLMTPGTLAEGATLNVQRISSEFYCKQCDATYHPGTDFRCPTCGAIGALTDVGSEFYIDSIEIERDDEQA